jgi:hypothetical protein
MSGFYITVKNGLLEPKHIKAMHGNKDSGAVWLFLWLLDKMTIIDHEKGEGKVLGGKPIKFDDIKTVLTVHRVTYQRWLNILREGGYIQTTRTPYGLTIIVNKAFKIFGQKSDVKRDVAQTLHLSNKKKRRSQADPATSLQADPATSNKTIQRQYNKKEKEIYKEKEKIKFPLEKISLEDIKEIAGKYNVPPAFVSYELETLRNYCEANGKKYNDYKAALRNFVLRGMKNELIKWRQRNERYKYTDASKIY